jgi:hypothetical protein
MWRLRAACAASGRLSHPIATGGNTGLANAATTVAVRLQITEVGTDRWLSPRRYSWRKAISGSTRAARRAGR